MPSTALAFSMSFSSAFRADLVKSSSSAAPSCPQNANRRQHEHKTPHHQQQQQHKVHTITRNAQQKTSTRKAHQQQAAPRICRPPPYYRRHSHQQAMKSAAISLSRSNPTVPYRVPKKRSRNGHWSYHHESPESNQSQRRATWLETQRYFIQCHFPTKRQPQLYRTSNPPTVTTPKN